MPLISTALRTGYDSVYVSSLSRGGWNDDADTFPMTPVASLPTGTATNAVAGLTLWNGTADSLYYNGLVGIGSTSPKATLDIDGYAKLKVYSGAPPVACSSTYRGSIALNASFIGCVCNGSNWVRLSDGSTSCTWP